MSKPGNDPVQQAASEAGMQFQKGETQKVRSRALHSRPVSERDMNMMARVYRIMQGSGGNSTPSEALKNAADPKLAKEIATIWWLVQNRHLEACTCGTRNPFCGLDGVTTKNMSWRLLENICDRSTGKMGPWTNGLSVVGAARNR